MNKTRQNTPLTVVLHEPRIPQNTGNVARTCAAFNVPLCLIEPLGFSLEDKYLKRAGLDYWPYVDVSTYKTFDSFITSLTKPYRIIGSSARGGKPVHEINFINGDILIFGREDMGLSSEFKSKCDFIATIKMPGIAKEDGKGGVRSLNLSIASSLVMYQAGHQLNLW